MARYIGPKSKISRKFGEPILGPSKALQKKAYAPGMHGRGRKRKQSEYAVQLNQKQKAKYIYGVLEKQCENLFHEAVRRNGITGTNLLQLLESRLDNVVFRLGVAPTRRAARQLVLHNHILVNGEQVSIPSFEVKPGAIIAVREKSKSLQVIVEALGARSSKKYPWLEWDNSQLAGKYLALPERELIPENIQEQLIVELYSK